MRTRVLRGVGPVLAVLMLGAAGCSTGEGSTGARQKASGQAVYGQQPAKQMIAARAATEKSRTARFAAELVYGSEGGDAVEHTTGSQDYARHTAQADRTVTVPKGFPADAAGLIGPHGKPRKQSLLIEDGDVLYRTGTGGWIRYEASQDLAEAASEMLAHAGDAVPYAGTLAEAVNRAVPLEQPEKRADGSRRYRLTLSSSSAEALLSPAMHSAIKGTALAGGGFDVDRMPLTVLLDAHGRLSRADADLGLFLKALHKEGMLRDVRSLRATYSLTDHGKPVAYRIPPASPATNATALLTVLNKAKAGECGTTDTGLESVALFVRVDCAAEHSLRVLGQVRVRETTTARVAVGRAYEEGENGCRDVFLRAPAAWRAEARPAGTFLTLGTDVAIVSSSGPEGSTNQLMGDFACYVATS